MNRPGFLLLTALVTAAPGVSPADELVPREWPINVVIDHYVRAGWVAEKIQPATLLEEAALVRRMTLDLAGRIPTTAETRAFVGSTAPTKWTRLADRLLESPDFDFHHRNQLDNLLLAAKKNDDGFRKYLLEASRQNRPWDLLFREMMVGREDKPGEKPALAFLKARAGSLDDLTVDTSSLFFGVNVGCAKCHDHPLVDDWKQDHFFGMASFFTRTYLTKKNTLAEKYSGTIKFKTTAGKEKQARFMFLTGTAIEEPKLKKTAEQRKAEAAEVKRQMKDAKAPPPKPPAFSPRLQLVELALRPADRGFFARSIVNRIWLRLIGHGIVDPPDQMHSANSPSHPELLDWLARDAAEHGYDLKRLIRGIVLSDIYAISSRWTGTGEPPPPETFAVGTVRPLSPRQYSLSLMIATADPGKISAQATGPGWAKLREQLENQSNGFAGQIERPGSSFQVSVDEALLFSNNERINNDFLKDAPDRLVGTLKGIADRRRLIGVAFQAVLSRSPAAEETAVFEQFLSKREKDLVGGIQQMVWALLTSPELRFNH